MGGFVVYFLITAVLHKLKSYYNGVLKSYYYILSYIKILLQYYIQSWHSHTVIKMYYYDDIYVDIYFYIMTSIKTCFI